MRSCGVRPRYSHDGVGIAHQITVGEHDPFGLSGHAGGIDEGGEIPIDPLRLARPGALDRRQFRPGLHLDGGGKRRRFASG